MANALQTGSIHVNESGNASGEYSAAQDTFYQSSVVCLGPNSCTPQDFMQALWADKGTWACIDRGNIGSLIPVWELVLHEPDVHSSAAELLKTVWMCSAGHWKEIVLMVDSFPDSLCLMLHGSLQLKYTCLPL